MSVNLLAPPIPTREGDHPWRSTTQNCSMRLQIQPFFCSYEHRWPTPTSVESWLTQGPRATSCTPAFQKSSTNGEKPFSLCWKWTLRLQWFVYSILALCRALVIFGEKEVRKTIKIPFLVIDCPSLYNCIIWRTELAQLGAACSTTHLKLKYHAKDDIIASLNGDIKAASRCFLQENKTQNSIFQSSKPAEDKGKTDASTLDANLVELDLRFTKEDLKKQKREKKDPLNAKPLRLILDGEFELVTFENDPSKNFKIGKDLPMLVKAQLVACLRENADLFTWSAADMPGIDPSVACHSWQLILVLAL